MRKFFTFVLCTLSLCHFAPMMATQRTVWTGDEPISWNPEVYAGTQFETPSGTFTGLQQGHVILVTVVAAIDEPQYVLTYKAGEGWNWTDLVAPVADGVMSYTVESAQIAAEIADRGLIFRGQGYNITQIVVDDMQGDDPTPQPQPEAEYEDHVVWTGDMAISWNPEAYAGAELDTYNVQQDMLAGLAKDDSIKVYFSDAVEGAQFALTYKAGEGWNWTDLVITQHDGFFAYKVASEEIAQDIADHGLVVRGQGYHATRIVIGKPKSATGFEQVPSDQVQSTKVIENGVLYIINNGIKYNVQGIRIE